MPTEAILTAFACMGAAITAMWISLKKDHDRIVRKQDQCEKDRKALHDEVGQLREVVGVIRLCRKDDCPVHATYSIRLR